MPSWSVHRIIGDVICGFHSPDIDRIVDLELGHDTSRYDVEKLMEAIDLIYDKYGEKGLRYFILHHYIDRLVDILIHEIISVYEEHFLSLIKESEKLYPKIKERSLALLCCDPKNLLSLFVCDLDTLLKVLRIVYSGKSKRKQRRAFEISLRAAYPRIIKHKKYLTLRLIVLDMIKKIHEHLDCIIFYILTDESLDRPRVVSRIVNSLYVKIAGYRYHANKYRKYGFEEKATRLENIADVLKKDITDFVLSLIKESHERCKALLIAK